MDADVPIPPVSAVPHPSGTGSLYLDSRGRAYLADRTRVPEYDGPAAPDALAQARADLERQRARTDHHAGGYGHAYAIEAAERKVKALEAASPAPGWVAVAERMPDRFETVLVTDGRHVEVSAHRVPTWQTNVVDTPTHWLPLPPLPGKERGA